LQKAGNLLLSPSIFRYFCRKIKRVRVTFLGTGTSQGVPVIACQCGVCKSIDPRDKRLRSSVLIEVSGVNIVIDAGPDFRQQMLRANVLSLQAILFTHDHKDHIAGLDDVRAYNWVEQKATDVYAEEYVQRTIKKDFSYAFADEKYPGVPEINLHTVYESPFLVHGIKVIPLRVKHFHLPVLGFRIGNFAYITDANSIPESTYELLDGVEILVINALRWKKHLSHFTLPEALAEIEKIKPQQAFVTHIGHQLGRHSEVSLKLPPNVGLAYDGLSFEL
jgi:phosphoribosyl 1,2-cyclic phosphate phosphodiesterase